MSVFSQWQSYRARTLPADAGDAQLNDCKRAFYAGARAMSDEIASVNTDDAVSGIAQLTGLEMELQAFAAGDKGRVN